ncbi:beta strand repeat-containing protein [Aliivibrio fischeri]|uniref:beta strand repeat-containing protein n=1 Tax=Aliivibrio fischeri TaxID=668 RepID=UPI0007C5630E|nr:Ig-like domain-containing protein [Aliivibrio fischeri]
MIKSTMIVWVKLLTLFFTAISLFGCNAEDAFSVPSTNDGSQKTLVSIQISPAEKLSFGRSDLQIAKGNKLPLLAMGTYSDGSNENITDKVDWASSDQLIVSVSGVGITRGEAEGQSGIVATLGDIISNELVILVNPAEAVSVQITPALKNIPVGSSQQYEAVATYTDGTTTVINNHERIEWFVSSPTKVTMTPTGKASAIGVGSMEIFAMLGDIKSNVADLIVTNAAIMSIQIEPAVKEIAKGHKQQYTAIGTLSDNTTEDVTNNVTWAVVGDGVSISESGLATGNEVGTVNIEASIGDVRSNKASLDVTDAVVTVLNITPLNTSIAKGRSQQYEAVATYSDGGKADVTTQVTWNSSDTSTATITNGTANGRAVGSTTINASFNGVNSEDAMLSVTAAEVVSLQVSPAVYSLAKGTSHQYTATATYTDGSFAAVNDDVSWQSSNALTATVTVGGLAAGVKVGQVTITASLDSIVSNDAELTVTSAALQSIQITPAMKSIAKGNTQQYEALGTYSDGGVQDISTLVSWSSSDTSLATISAQGLASGVAIGNNIDIKATLGSTTSNTAVLNVTAADVVSIQITPPSASVAKGNSQQYTATGTYTDDTTADISSSVNWFSSDTSVASITSAGLATGISEGEVNVHATFNSITSNNVTLTVTAAELESIQITPPVISIAKGNTQQYAATGYYSDDQNVDITDSVTWISSNPALVTISSGVSGGLANGDHEGQVKISAEFNSNVSNEATLSVTAAKIVSIQVTPATVSIAEGNTQQYLATATYTDNRTADVTNSVSWSSSDTDLATIDARGLATGVGVGEVQVIAVKDGISSNEAILTVISASVVSIQVTPPTKSIAKGDTQQYVAMATYNNSTTKDVSNSVSWSSSNSGLATITSEGLATGVTEGVVTINASLNGITSNSASLTITSAVIRSLQITPAVQSIPKGSQHQYTAIATYSDNSTSDVTGRVNWNSSDRDIATITSTGLAQGVIEGEVSISGSLNGISGNDATLTVTAVAIQSLVLTPETASIVRGTTQQYSAIATYSDNSTIDATLTGSWSSSSSRVATINRGVASGVRVGQTDIQVWFDGILSNVASLTVTDPVLVSLDISPETTSIVRGGTQRFVAVGTYSDSRVSVLTNLVSWNSDASIATISDSGVATGVGVGSTAIKATFRSVQSNTVNLSVTAPVLSGIAVTPVGSSVVKGATKQFTAMAEYSGGAPSVDITDTVDWHVSDTSIATISLTGEVTGVTVGLVKVTATQGNISSNEASLTVDDERLIPLLPDGSSIWLPPQEFGWYEDNLGITPDGQYIEDGISGPNGKSIGMFTFANARLVCSKMNSSPAGGGYTSWTLPLRDHFDNLTRFNSNMFVDHGWPAGQLVWSSTANPDFPTASGNLIMFDLTKQGPNNTSNGLSSDLYYVACDRFQR